MNEQVKPPSARPPEVAVAQPARSGSPITAQPATPAAPKFRPIHTRRAFEEICERIREQLALGVLKPGDKLPPERDLAQQLGVSRNVLREALRSLEMAGVLAAAEGRQGWRLHSRGRHQPHERRHARHAQPWHDLGAGIVGSARSTFSISWCGWPAPMRGRPISMHLRPTSSARSWPRGKGGCWIASNARASSTACSPLRPETR